MMCKLVNHVRTKEFLRTFSQIPIRPNTKDNKTKVCKNTSGFQSLLLKVTPCKLFKETTDHKTSNTLVSHIAEGKLYHSIIYNAAKEMTASIQLVQKTNS